MGYGTLKSWSPTPYLNSRYWLNCPTVKHSKAMASAFCRCGALRRPKGRDCRFCHNWRMRCYRAIGSIRISKEQRKHIKARTYARIYQRRGKLTPKPCEICGNEKVEKHHPDYNQPLKIVWVCKRCHLAIHRIAKKS